MLWLNPRASDVFGYVAYEIFAWEKSYSFLWLRHSLRPHLSINQGKLLCRRPVRKKRCSNSSCWKKQINSLVNLAISEGDHITQNMLNWVLAEQLEEVSSMETLLTVANRAGDNLLYLEEYVARHKQSLLGKSRSGEAN